MLSGGGLAHHVGKIQLGTFGQRHTKLLVCSSPPVFLSGHIDTGIAEIEMERLRQIASTGFLFDQVNFRRGGRDIQRQPLQLLAPHHPLEIPQGCPQILPF
jgi:hypothetical protein